MNRTRYSSNISPPNRQKPKATKPKQKSSKATEDDARRAGIPPGYSYRVRNPTEEPIMLLGSVFDPSSLGKWIYDWTVFFKGPAAPLAEVAAELWLLFIQLAGKVKRAKECMSKIRRRENVETVEEFLMSDKRLWFRFAEILHICGESMWKAAKQEDCMTKPIKMGKNSAREFIDSMFGRDRELAKIEKLMTGKHAL